LFNNRANRSLQDLQTQTQREKLGAHAPHVSRGAISQYNTLTHNTKTQNTPRAAHDTKKQNTSSTNTRAATKHTQTKTPPKQPSQKRRAQKIDSARRQRLGAQSLKKAGGAKTGGQIRLACKGGARDPIAPNSRQKLYTKAATICPRNLFLFNTYKKYKILFILAYI